MPFWDRLRESTQTMQTQLLSKKNELKSGAFRDASMAMCALVAAADGSVDPAERQRTASLIASNEVLQNFPADDLQRRFNDYVSKLTADFDFGKVSVLQDIGKTKQKPAEARAVIQIGIVIGGADGDFDNSERPSSGRRASRSASTRPSSNSDRRGAPARRGGQRRASSGSRDDAMM
jgi:tellurite resistance protein TerB